MGARFLDEWLTRLPTGFVGRDYAERLTHELEALAVARDTLQRPSGRLFRRLTRVK